ncbi:hypothetical protein [Stenotrophobium rhamnosiphilum]|uniref:Uncharacterized protein n=1 Tax=Stenotrophobium rhamnosiphilum TaxID=2029166 RepID=A0A2T5MB08_9GAMM|nr:hypothetical protein [Stenotrophobium rhamnosiphilum]PTU27697.1 hypothetical protein CJD38_18295 [Stenotrophobium rhamnosiphilum]
MNAWNKLLIALDQALGFPNKVESRISKKVEGFDRKTNEHVFQLEYRVRVNRGAAQQAPAKPAPNLTKDQTSNVLRTLLAMNENP